MISVFLQSAMLQLNPFNESGPLYILNNYGIVLHTVTVDDCVFGKFETENKNYSCAEGDNWLAREI